MYNTEKFQNILEFQLSAVDSWENHVNACETCKKYANCEDIQTYPDMCAEGRIYSDLIGVIRVYLHKEGIEWG